MQSSHQLDIENIANQFLNAAKDNVITTAELNKLTKDVSQEKFTFDETKRLLDTLFTKTIDTLNDSEAKKKTQCLKTVVSHLVETFFDEKSGLSDAIFFPGEEGERRLIKYLSMATKTLEICVFTISNDRIAQAVENLHKKGVAVRIISDDESSKNNGSDIEHLAKVGIPTRTDSDAKVHMHNKYVIIDNKILITGSFNWTWQAVKSNQENLIIIEKPELVQRFKESYEKLWVQFKNNQV